MKTLRFILYKNITAAALLCFALGSRADTITVSCSGVAMDSLVIVTTNIICGGVCDGNAKVIVYGGMGPYSYDWFPLTPSGDGTDSIFLLCASTYSLVVYDLGDGSNTCVAPSIPITSNPPITGFISPPSPTTKCFGVCNGSASITVLGGIPPYAYLWSDGETTSTATALCPGLNWVIYSDSKACNDSSATTVGQPPILVNAVSGKNISCNGLCDGEAVSLPSGGTPPYTHLWNTGDTNDTLFNLCAGTYVDTLRDSNGCTSIASVVIIEPTALSLIMDSVNVSCGGLCNGKAIVSVSGGTVPYTYLWDASPPQTTDTATGLCLGLYHVTVTDSSGCQSIDSVSITAPPILTVNTDSIDVLCNGDSTGCAIALPVGGTPPYSFLWNTGQTTSTICGLAAGVYCVTVADNLGCQDTACVNIDQPPPLLLLTDSVDISCNGLCNGKAIVAPGSGIPPYTYLWNDTLAQTTDTATGLCPGIYCVTVTDSNGCVNTACVNIDQPPPLTLSTTKTDVICNGSCDGTGTATPGGGVLPYTYTWDAVPVQTTALATGLCIGIWHVTVADSNGCFRNDSVSISQPTAVIPNSAISPAACGVCDGMASVSPTGGVPPYIINWYTIPSFNDTIFGVCSGLYPVKITDANGCIDTFFVAVSDISATLLTMDSTNATCNDLCNGTATVHATGSPPFTFSWNTTPVQTDSIATGLCDSTYTVSVTDIFGCDVFRSVIISEPDTISANITAIDVSCFSICDGIVVSAPSGGVPPYTHSWETGSTNDSLTALCPGTYTDTIRDLNGCLIIDSGVVNGQLLLAVTTDSIDILCNGDSTGSAIVIPSGGKTPYTYAWNTIPLQTDSIASGLPAGIYCVTVTDVNFCTADTCVNLDQPPPLILVITKTNVLCNGACNGTGTVTPSGGVPPYTYSWNTTPVQTDSTATGLCAGGPYCVTVTDANGCMDSVCVMITEPLVLSTTISNTNVSCNGGCNGTGTVIPAGGTIPYTYSWSNGDTTATADSLCAAKFFVTVTDSNACTALDSVTITEPVVLFLGMDTVHVLCNGDSTGCGIALPVGGTPPYSFVWNTTPVQTTSTICGLVAGTYCVTITDSLGCKDSACVIVTQPTAIAPGFVTVSAACGVCDGAASSTPTGGTPAYTFNWFGVPSSNDTISSRCAGVYDLQITDANDCIDTFSVGISNFGGPTIDSIDSAGVSCFGFRDGTATVHITPGSGNPPYTFLWNDALAQTDSIADSLFAGGPYLCSITDNISCIIIASVNISTPSAIVSNISGKNISCFGSCDGETYTAPAGGVPGYSHLWSPGGAATDTVTGLCAGTYSDTITDITGCILVDTVILTQPASLSVGIIDSTNISCNGVCDGKATVSVSGGILPYTYVWSNSDSDTLADTLCANTQYNVTVTDSMGCQAFDSVTLSEPPLLTAIITDSTNINCNGLCNGDAEVTAGGGTLPYTYVWSNLDSNTLADTLCANTQYNVTVTDSMGCQAFDSVTLSEPTVLTATITDSANISCNGLCNGNATVNASGGTTPYTYMWSNLDSDTLADTLCANTQYNVTVTDSLGCQAFDSVTLSEPLPLSVIISDSSNISCNGLCDGTATGSVTGGTPPYTYLWNNPDADADSLADSLCPAVVFTLTVTDSMGCSDSDSISLSEPGSLTDTILSSNNITCNGACDGTAEFSPVGGTAPYIHSWSNGDTTALADSLCAGIFHVDTIRDANGCIVLDSVSLSEPPALFSGIVDSTNLTCNSECIGTATDSSSGGNPPYSYAWNTIPVQTDLTATGLCGDSLYTVVTTDSIGCTDTATVMLSQPPLIIITFTDSAYVSCNGLCDGFAVINVIGGIMPYTYLWNDTLTQTDTIADSLCAGFAVVTVTDSNLCVMVDSIDITEPLLLGLDTLNTTEASCNGTCDAAATVSGTGGTLPYTYLWNTIPPDTDSTADSLCATLYFVTVTDGNGCVATDTVVITGPNGFTCTISDTAMVSCNGGCDGSATVNASGGIPPYTYSWWDTAGVSIPGTSDTISGLCKGVYIAQVLDGTGCVTFIQFEITEPLPLTPVICLIKNVTCNAACDGAATVCASGGTPPFTYNWDDPLLQTDSIADSLCADTFQIQVIDGNGCISINTLVIVAEPGLLSCLFTDTTNVSCDTIIPLGSATVVASGGVPPYSYLWNTTPQQTDTVAVSLFAGPYDVTVTDSNECASICSITITDTSDMDASISAQTNVSCFGNCDGSATVTTTGSTIPYTYNWLDFMGIPIGDTDSVGNLLCAGLHRVIVISNSMCERSIPAVITEPLPLIATITDSSNVLCQGDSTGFAAVTPTGGTPPYTYIWMDTSGAPIGIIDSTADSLSVGIYCVAVTDSNGCSDSICISITEPSALTVSITTVIMASCSNSCDGSASATPAGGILPYTYLWLPDSITDSTASGLCVDTFTITITDNNGCVALDTVVIPANITVNANAGPDRSVCQGDSVTLIGNGGLNYEWFIAGSSVSASSSFTTVPPDTGYTNYVLVVSESICSDTDSTSVYVIPVNVDAGPDITLAEGNCTPIIASGGVTYIWSPSNGLNDPNVFNPVACPDESITYFVTATNDSGCVGIDSVTINIVPEIADGFTPNGDGFNDFWEIPLLKFYPDAEVQVYNRWGEQVFNSPQGNKYVTKFDGKYEGKDLPVGTYYYVIKLNDGLTKPFTGPVTIMRK